LDAADATTISFSSGSNVSQWRDKSGNLANATMINAAVGSPVPPTYTLNTLNGLPVITMSGTSYLQGSLSTTGTTSTSFMVFRCVFGTGGSSQQRAFCVAAAGVSDFTANGGGAIIFSVISSGTSILTYRSANLASRTVTNGSTNIACSTFSGTSNFMYVNGNTPGTAASTETFASTLFAVGSDAGIQFMGGASSLGTNCLVGYVAEVIHYNYFLSDAQRQSVEGYLASKWGLRTLMPLIHPFYSLRPSNRGFSPLDIPGCQLWLDGADLSSMTLSGINVTQWSDKSGSGNHATGGVSPTYSSSAGAVLFNGTSSYLQTSLSAVPTVETVFAVFRASILPTQTDAGAVIFGATGSGGRGFVVITNATSGSTAYQLRYDAYAVGNIALTPYGGVIYNTLTLATAQYTGGQGAGSTNGSSFGSFQSLSFSGSTTTRIGAVSGGGFFNGTINEILIYNTALAAPQRQQIEGYLAAKWGLTSTLPVHPYKTLPPTTSQPAQYSEVSPGNWTHDWQPYLRALTRANSNAVASFSSDNLTGSVAYGYGGVLAPNSKIYCIPFTPGGLASPTVSVFNLITNSISSFGTVSGDYAYIGGVLAPNGKIYCIPANATAVGFIDPITDSFDTTTVTGTAPGSFAYRGGVLAPNGKIYCIPSGATAVGVIDPILNTFTTFGGSISGANKYSGGVLAPNGKIYCIPFNATAVGVIDPIANTFTTPVTGAAPGSLAYNGGVLAPNGKIYCIPTNTSAVGVIDPIANTFTTPVTGTAPGTDAYSSGVLAPNGKIYCIPFSATTVGVIDPVLNTFSSNSVTGTTPGAYSYLGGVLAPNGTIYCIPFSAGPARLITSTGAISFSGLSQLPSSNYCLSAWTNKF
jgi:hypothetical protein